MSRILITSALPGVNGVKHLGNLVGSMLPADVYARFQRARGHEVLSICGTDDHGTPAELAADAAGQDVLTCIATNSIASRTIWGGASACPGICSGERLRRRTPNSPIISRRSWRRTA